MFLCSFVLVCLMFNWFILFCVLLNDHLSLCYCAREDLSCGKTKLFTGELHQRHKVICELIRFPQHVCAWSR